MKKYLSLIFILILCLASSIVVADNLFYDNFEDNDCTDWVGCTIESTIVSNGTYSGKIASAEDLYAPVYTGISENYNISSWVYLSATGGDYKAIIAKTTAGGWTSGAMLYWESGAANNCVDNFFCDYEGGTYTSTGIAVPYGVWSKVTMEFNGTVDRFNFYLNDSLGKANAVHRGSAAQNTLTTFGIHRANAASTEDYFDDVSRFNYSEFIPLIAEKINLSGLVYPLNETQYAYSTINFNITGNYSVNANVSLFLNGTLSSSITALAGTNRYTGFNVPLTTDNAYLYYFNVTNISDSSGELDGSFQTDPQTLFIDTVDPVIVSGFSNNQILPLGSNLVGQFNLSDTFMLYSYNLSINGTQIAYAGNLNQQTAQYNLSYDTSGLSVGNHQLSVTVADGHTAKKLKQDYGVNRGLFNSYLRYNMYGESYVRIESQTPGIFNTFTTEREQDRYTFNYIPRNPAATQHLTISSDEVLNVVETNSQYKDYIILGDHWLDFVTLEDPGITINIVKLTDYTARVTVGNITNKTFIKFSSIGDLNIVTQTYDFSTTNASVIYSSAVSELEQQTITFNINKTSMITSTDASLIYNGTLKSSVKTSYPNYDNYISTFITPDIEESQTNLSFYWNYTLYSSTLNYTGNVTQNQTVYAIEIDNCTTYTTRAINFTLIDLDTLNQVNGTLSGYFQAWVDVISSYTSVNLTWGTSSNFGVCINLPNTEYQFYSQMEYGASGYEDKTYYFQNSTLNNVTKNVNLYLENSTTEITFTVTDLNDNPIEDVYIHVLSYNLATNTFTTTEILNTDDAGIALGQLVLGGWYKFILNYNTQIVLETTPSIINSATKTFRLNLDSNYLEDNYDVYNGIVHTLTFDNTTKTFDFTYSQGDSTPVDVCLKVIRQEVMGDTQLTNVCPTAVASGTIFYTISENVTGRTYLATSYLQFGNNTKTFILKTLSVDFDGQYKTWGLDGVFVTFLLLTTAAMVGIWSPVVAVFLLLIGLIAAMIMNIFFLSWGAIMALIIIGIIAMYRLNR